MSTFAKETAGPITELYQEKNENKAESYELMR